MERLFGAIPSVLKDLGGDERATEALIFAAWKECAGPLINERTQAIECFEARLVIAVADNTWRTHLEDLSPQMVARLNSRLGHGAVKFIEFRVDPSAFHQGVRTPDELTHRVPAELPASLREAADAISDQDLRETFLEAAAVYLTRK